MESLGHGAQFEVATDGDYVYKTLHTIEESAAIYKRWGYGLVTRNLEQLATDTLDHARLSLEGVRRLLEGHPELGPTLANPVIDDDLNYRQDRVAVMGEALRQAKPDRARRYIDEFIDLLLFHAGYGLADPILQMGSNYGVNKLGRVVLLDIGELAFDKETAMRAAAKKTWRKADTYYSPLSFYTKHTIPLPLKPYYRRQMLRRFTPEVIEMNWLKATRPSNDKAQS